VSISLQLSQSVIIVVVVVVVVCPSRCRTAAMLVIGLETLSPRTYKNV